MQRNDLESIFSTLLSDIEKYSKLGNFIIQGDFNAYTNTQPDFILFDKDSHCVNGDDLHNQYDSTLWRDDLDHKHTNNSEKLLLNICRETVIRILNNRTTADLTGKHTCYTYNGYSLVVYTLTAQDQLKSVFWNPKIFNVFLPLSN